MQREGRGRAIQGVLANMSYVGGEGEGASEAMTFVAMSHRHIHNVIYAYGDGKKLEFQLPCPIWAGQDRWLQQKERGSTTTSYMLLYDRLHDPGAFIITRISSALGPF